MALSWAVFGQVDSADLRPPKPPKVKKELKEYIPTGVMIGVDVFRIGRSIWEDELTLQEYQAEVDLRHYHLTLGYGWSNIDRQSETTQYSNDGRYWRLNLEANFIYKSPFQSKLFVGLGYARATFDDKLIFQTEDAFGTTEIVSSNDRARARWFELTTGVKVRVWKQFYMGYTVRYKFLKEVNFDNLIPGDIPGFGENRQDDKDQFGFNYYLYWRFPVRNSAKILSAK